MDISINEKQRGILIGALLDVKNRFQFAQNNKISEIVKSFSHKLGIDVNIKQEDFENEIDELIKKFSQK